MSTHIPDDRTGLQKIAGCDKGDRALDVVFIHGLGGDAWTTWMADEGDISTFWPNWVAEDFPQVGLWTLGYAADSTKWKEESMPLADRGNQVLESLANQDLGRRPLLFITHSMGGIVAKQILRNAESFGVLRWESLYKRTKGIAFIATPHSGANIANFAELAKAVYRTNEHVGELAAHDSRLRELHGWFLYFHRRHNVICRTYCEKRELRPEIPVLGIKLPKGMLVVDATSAEPNIPGERAIPLDEDHISICKPQSKTSDLYQSLTGFLNECLTAVSHPSGKPVTGSVPSAAGPIPAAPTSAQSSGPVERKTEVIMLAVNLRESTALDAKLEKAFGDQCEVPYIKIMGQLQDLVDTAVSQSSCIKESRGFHPGLGVKSYKKDSARLLFHSHWRHFDVMGAIESALWLKQHWDATNAISEHSDGKCEQHGLAIAVHIESLPVGQALSYKYLNATKTFRLLAKVSENYPDPSTSFVAITTECLDHLKPKTAISFSGPTKANVGKHATENMTYHLVSGDLELASKNASCGFYFVKHGLVDLKLDGLCPPDNPEVEVGLWRPLKLEFLRTWIDGSRNKIRILQTYIPEVEALREDLFAALQRKVNIEVLLLQPMWTLERLNRMLPPRMRVNVEKDDEPVPSLFAIQRDRELAPAHDRDPYSELFPLNIMHQSFERSSAAMKAGEERKES